MSWVQPAQHVRFGPKKSVQCIGWRCRLTVRHLRKGPFAFWRPKIVQFLAPEVLDLYLVFMILFVCRSDQQKETGRAPCIRRPQGERIAFWTCCQETRRAWTPKTRTRTERGGMERMFLRIFCGRTEWPPCQFFCVPRVLMHPKYSHYCEAFCLVVWAQAERQERERQKRMEEAREAQWSLRLLCLWFLNQIQCWGNTLLKRL